LLLCLWVVDKVFVGIYYETVVITRAKKRADAVPALRAALGERHGREAAPVSLMNHIALVYWSDKRKSSWYRLPGSDDACAIHPSRVGAALRALVPTKEPDRAGWDGNTSASRKP